MSIADFDQKKFLKEVRDFMKVNGLSVRAFCKLADVAIVTIYRLEEEENEITFSTIRKLEKAMASYKKEDTI